MRLGERRSANSLKTDWNRDQGTSVADRPRVRKAWPADRLERRPTNGVARPARRVVQTARIPLMTVGALRTATSTAFGRFPRNNPAVRVPWVGKREWPQLEILKEGL
jgi:hypothetical protein